MVYVPDANNKLKVYPFPSGGGGGGGSSLANFYLKDSSLDNNRTINQAAHDLIFHNGSKFSIWNMDSLNINNLILSHPSGGGILTIQPVDQLSHIYMGNGGYTSIDAVAQVEVITPQFTVNGYSFPAADGSANQVLKTDGVGVVSWATIGTQITNERFTGSTSSTLTFTHTLYANLVVYKNGVRLDPSTDYTNSSSAITLIVPRISGDVFLIDYKY